MTRPEVRLTRRRYGRHTYTWADISLGGKWISLGDPWPSVRLPKRELEAAITAAITQHLSEEMEHA